MPLLPTRRGFLKASVAAAPAAVAAVTILGGCKNTSDGGSAQPTVVDEDKAVSVTEAYEYVEPTLAASAEYRIDLGNVLHPAEGTWIPVTTAGASATPMVVGSALSIASGTLATVVPDTMMATANAVIYDVRCSDSAYAWVEVDYVTREWSLFAAPFSDGALSGDAKMLWKADADWDPAPFAVSGGSVLWQVQPSTSGKKTSESSHCYLWKVGEKDAQAVVESPGRFATSPVVSNGVVVLTPRVLAEKGVYYGVTAYSLDDDLSTKIDQLVMPQAVRPFGACRVGDRFMVSVEASYSAGGLLSKMGTYIATSNGDFVKLDREPSELGCGHGNAFVVKSRSSYFLIDVDAQTYSSISCMDRAVDYGEFPARVGDCETFVTFSTVKDADSGYPAAVVVRTFAI